LLISLPIQDAVFVMMAPGLVSYRPNSVHTNTHFLLSPTRMVAGHAPLALPCKESRAIPDEYCCRIWGCFLFFVFCFLFLFGGGGNRAIDVTSQTRA
jgi:hypothetical protein